MNTQVVFNIDRKIKARAMKRAKSEGIPFSSMLKMATKAYATGDFSIGFVEEVYPHKLRLWEKESKLMDEGKGTRLKSMSEYRDFVKSL